MKNIIQKCNYLINLIHIYAYSDPTNTIYGVDMSYMRTHSSAEEMQYSRYLNDLLLLRNRSIKKWHIRARLTCIELIKEETETIYRDLYDYFDGDVLTHKYNVETFISECDFFTKKLEAYADENEYTAFVDEYVEFMNRAEKFYWSSKLEYPPATLDRRLDILTSMSDDVLGD